MRSQAERDQQTITITTGLTIFMSVVLAVLLLALLLNAVTDLKLTGGAASALGFGTVLLGAAASLGYLWRHRRS